MPVAASTTKQYSAISPNSDNHRSSRTSRNHRSGTGLTRREPSAPMAAFWRPRTRLLQGLPLFMGLVPLSCLRHKGEESDPPDVTSEQGNVTHFMLGVLRPVSASGAGVQAG